MAILFRLVSTIQQTLFPALETQLAAPLGEKGERFVTVVELARPEEFCAGFEWQDTEGVFDKLAEELGELRETEVGSPEAAEELGDVLFTVVNLARRYGVDAETALRGMNEKFSRRWRAMEAMAGDEGRPIGEYGAEGLEILWQRAKRAERAGPEQGD